MSSGGSCTGKGRCGSRCGYGGGGRHSELNDDHEVGKDGTKHLKINRKLFTVANEIMRVCFQIVQQHEVTYRYLLETLFMSVGKVFVSVLQ